MDDEQLIIAVGKYDFLFNPTSKHYKDIRKKENAWVKIAQQLDVTAEDCRIRWKNLRDVYVKHQKKIQSKKSGDSAKAIKPWKYSQAMSFLKKHLQLRSTSGNLPGNDEKSSDDDLRSEAQETESRSDTDHSDFSDSEDGTTDQSSIHSTMSRTTPTTPNATSTPRARAPGKKRKATADMFENRVMDYLETGRKLQPTSPEKDDLEMFLLSLAPALRRLNPRKQSSARMRIQGVLDDLEFGPVNDHYAAHVYPAASQSPVKPMQYTRQGVAMNEPQYYSDQTVYHQM